MVKNLFIIAVRNLLKSKTFSLINILGLAFGLCCALLISLWVIDEYSIDNFHSKKDRIYSVISELKSSSGSQYWTNSPGPLAEALKKDITGIEEAVRYSHSRKELIKYENQYIEERGISADPEILNVFDFPFIQGDPKSALAEPNNIVVSNELANKLFPNTNALDQTITITEQGEDKPYKITGVMEDLPEQSTLQFSYITPYETYLKTRPWNLKWGNYNDMTMVLVEEDADFKNVSDQIIDVIRQHQEGSEADLHLYPFKDKYLKADFSNGMEAEGRIVYVRIFSIIAIIIVLIACINFMNLSTARAGKRAKEVGVRKATGASRKSLIMQFLGESILIALISGVLAVTMADLLMVPFNELTGKSLSMLYGSPAFMLSILLLCILTGMLAGIYPALYLSGFSPSEVLKNAINSGKSLSGFRRVLVVLQFSLSITFVVTTMIVYGQLQFILNKDLGLKKENILSHHLYSIIGQKEAYRNEVLKIPGVQNMASTNFSPLSIGNSTSSISWQGKEDDEDIYFHVMKVDKYFVETFGVAVLEGKGFTNVSDSILQVLINEEAVETMYLENPIGSRITVWGDEVEIVGVVKNFHHQSLTQKIDPVIMYLRPQQTWRNHISITGDVTQVVGEIEKIYSKFETNYPFDYSFVDQNYAKTYKNVSDMGRLSNIFAFVTIFVSCLGLFGLASYMTEQRKKETGIRKVLGASIISLVTMFTRSFLSLVVISFVISVPVAWYLSTLWLSDFAFKIDIGASPFIIGGLSAMLIASATVSYHTIRVAIANPVDSLKYE